MILTSRGQSEEAADWQVGAGEGGTCGFDWPHAGHMQIMGYFTLLTSPAESW